MLSVTLRNLAVRLVVAVVLTFCQNLGSARADEITVNIDNFTFEPAQLTVKVGTTVTWKNRDDIPHTIVSAGKFKSKALDTDDSYSFTFTTPGTYKYFCYVHPHMTGTIVVAPKNG